MFFRICTVWPTSLLLKQFKRMLYKVKCTIKKIFRNSERKRVGVQFCQFFLIIVVKDHWRVAWLHRVVCGVAMIGPKQNFLFSLCISSLLLRVVFLRRERVVPVASCFSAQSISLNDSACVSKLPILQDLQQSPRKSPGSWRLGRKVVFESNSIR